MLGTIYAFGDYRLDSGRFELNRNGHVLSLERKPLELLILLVERDGQLVTRAEIAERLWNREVFVDTEHGINTAIRKIRNVLQEDSAEPRFIQTVTGKGYRFAMPITAEPQAAERATPIEAIPVDTIPPVPDTPLPEASAPSSIAAPQPGFSEIAFPGSGMRRLKWVLPGIAICAVTIALAARNWSHRQEFINIHSLAVLPLDNVSGDPSQEYFADGLTDELTTMLAKDSTLRIVSRTSVMQYKHPLRPLSEIAHALGVESIVEGSVTRSGNNLHLTLQLIRADNDSHLWAESYDRDANDVTLPDEAARVIAKQLHSEAPSAPPARYVNPAAREAYLRGKFLWSSSDPEKSAGYFRKAIEIQPDYAAAWAGLSNYYGQGMVNGSLDARSNIKPHEEAAERALQLDPNLAEAHAAMATVFFFDKWDWANADRELLRAIALAPQNAEYCHLRAILLKTLNRFPEAIELEKKSLELSSTNRPGTLAKMYISARQYDNALADLKVKLDASPRNPEWLITTMDAYRRKGDFKEAAEYWARFYEVTGQKQAAIGVRRAFQRGGAHGFSRWQLNARLKDAQAGNEWPQDIANYYAQLGEKEEALSWLEESYRQHVKDVLWIQNDPAYDFLHKEPRYRALIQNIGLPPAY
jgi:TolB-like protein/DNA-binding winged helix-turn-helix (wHTH) protein/Tfp pilus assembly protein PilF